MSPARDLTDVFQYLADHQQQTLDDLARFCAQPSVSTEGRGMTEMVELVRERLAKSNFAVHVYPLEPGFPVIYAESQDQTPDDAPILLIYNHYDVQPEGDQALWTTPPFEPTIRDGKFYARGVADNKGNFIARLAAVDALRATYGELPLKIKWVIEGGEEIGSPNLDSFIQEHVDQLQADGCIWEFGGFDWQGTPEIKLGLKGILLAQLSCRGPVRDVHSSMAAFVSNPAWRLTWALATLKDENEYITIEGFYDKLRPPTSSELQMVAALPDDDEILQKEIGVSEFAVGVQGYQRRVAEIFSPTCNIQGIASGFMGEGSKTILPGFASAKLDLRLVPDQDPDEILELIREHLHNKGFDDIQVDLIEGSVFPARSNPDAPFVQLTRDACAELMDGKQPLVAPSSPASGPMYSFTNTLKLPVVAIGVGYPASAQHAPNENIRLDDFEHGTKLIALLMARMAEMGADALRVPAAVEEFSFNYQPAFAVEQNFADAPTGLPEFDFDAIAAEMEGGIEESYSLPASQRPDVDEALADINHVREIADVLQVEAILDDDDPEPVAAPNASSNEG